MEMHQVRYFLAVARVLNFTRAAEECHVTQPSLTRAIQKLEEEFGGLLFHRERALTHLTDLGRLMLPHLERTFAAAQAAKSLAKSVGLAQVAPLHLGIARAIAPSALDGILTTLVAGLPGLELRLTVGSSEHLLDLAMKGALDLMVICEVQGASPRLDAWPLLHQRFHMLTRSSHPLAHRQRITMAELSQEVWIDCDDDGTSLLRWAAGEAGFEPRIRHKVNSTGHAMRLIELGLGSALLPPGDGPHPGLATLEIEDQLLRREFVLASIAGRPRSIAADAFMRAARARSRQTDPDQDRCPDQDR